MTKVTIGFLSLILALGASLWIAEGVHLVSLEFPSSSLACSGPDESESKRYRIPWKIYVNGHAESAKTFASFTQVATIIQNKVYRIQKVVHYFFFQNHDK
jgi:hypothetical protein